MPNENKHELPFWEFKILFDLLLNKLTDCYEKYNIENSSNHRVPESINLIVGYRTGSAEKNEKEKKEYPLNLTDLINTDPLSARYIIDYHKQLPFQEGQRRIVTSNYLRTLGNFYKGKPDVPQTVELEGLYYNVFYKFLGLTDREEFQKKYFQKTDYKGYYYSDVRNEIAGFDISFFELNVGQNNKEAKLFVEEVGFHDAISETKLFGEVSVFLDCWTVRLRHGNFFIDLSFSISGINNKINYILKSNHLFGTVSGLSSQHKLLCLECVFVKKECIEQSLLTVERYLSLKRNLFTVHINNSLVMNSLDDLEINDTSVSKIHHLSDKTFRVFAAAPKGRIVQSKYVINKNYSASIIVPGVKDNKPLRCKPSFSNISLQRVIWNVYLDLKNLYSTTVIEVPTQMEEGQIIHGAFCICENSKNTIPIGNILVMCEDEDSAIVPGIYSKDKLTEILNTPNSQKLYEAFKENVVKWKNMG